ncbi:hypothetical protein CYLTODRAFT_446062 [Cylindrobasidium torrendii FP15055 ss-10]|uniref:C2H2-type domain-containing protein n=1 Tax=Cylindrobasidium torrendii FP15055 ss-10 TaxID=1314674 RepID=A0A0D7B1J0_9AGAR|nr:hypothetical protein CYLTODRAFT_446062 [Cylindrobasidium torrendii FP15055 ss-10]
MASTENFYYCPREGCHYKTPVKFNLSAHFRKHQSHPWICPYQECQDRTLGGGQYNFCEMPELLHHAKMRITHAIELVWQANAFEEQRNVEYNPRTIVTGSGPRNPSLIAATQTQDVANKTVDAHDFLQAGDASVLRKSRVDHLDVETSKEKILLTNEWVVSQYTYLELKDWVAARVGRQPSS